MSLHFEFRLGGEMELQIYCKKACTFSISKPVLTTQGYSKVKYAPCIQSFGCLTEPNFTALQGLLITTPNQPNFKME